MTAQNYQHNKDKQTNSASYAPATEQTGWRFGDLPSAELLPLLQRHLITQDNKAQWQLVWLNNNGKSVIGLLPKTTWCVYFNHTDANYNYHTSDPAFIPTKTTNDRAIIYKIIKNCRDDNSFATTKYMNYTDWQEELITYSQTYESSYRVPSRINEEDNKPSYQNGLIGFIGYDMAAHELSPTTNTQQLSQPCAVLGHYDIYLTPTDDTDSSEIEWTLNIKTTNHESHDVSVMTPIAPLISYLDALDSQLNSSLNTNKSTFLSALPLAPLILTAQWSKGNYQQAFDQTQRYLQQGDCYQINLTQAWQGRLYNLCNNNSAITTLIDYLPALHRNTQAPFAGYISVGTLENNSLKTDDIKLKIEGAKSIGFELLSCSPELFFTFTKDNKTDTHHIRTKPIKGTRPRGMNAEQDLTLKQQLSDSAKDRAENVMIVDLLRNDLGKYAKTGSVKVPHLFNIESFSNVHHMVSTITAELKAETHPLAVLFGSLPAGSITGTPKKRAVEIISELEAAPRGAYCGTMGYMNFDGSGQWNVLIRTLQAGYTSDSLLQSSGSVNSTRQISLWAGGGITIASDCDDEYQECLDKVGNLLNVLRQTDSV